jgi:hypothetical protein
MNDESEIAILRLSILSKTYSASLDLFLSSEKEENCCQYGDNGYCAVASMA